MRGYELEPFLDPGFWQLPMEAGFRCFKNKWKCENQHQSTKSICALKFYWNYLLQIFFSTKGNI